MKAKIISLCQLLTALAMCGLLVLAYTGCGGGNDDDDDAYGDAAYSNDDDDAYGYGPPPG